MSTVSRGLGIALLSSWESRSISAENPTGGVGQGARAERGTGAVHARGLGRGWKISPSIAIRSGESAVLADIDGPGAIQHIWMSMKPDTWRSMVLRFTWDNADRPAVEVPLGDLFCLGWEEYAPVNSRYVVVAPYCGLNTYWPMPFAEHARVTLENIGEEERILYYYIDYVLGEIPREAAYFHAFWNRANPVGEDHIHTILPRVHDVGSYVGTHLSVGTNHPGWWGEGEVKFFIDADRDFPTICGTGTEDYFGGAADFDVPQAGYTTYSTPYLGLHQVLRPDGLYQSQQRFSMYRWHEADAVRFRESLEVTVQDLGWRPGMQYLARRDDIASTAIWYGKSPEGQLEADLRAELLEVRSHPDFRLS